MKTNDLFQNAGSVRVIIADDHHVVRAGLRGLLESQSRISVVGEAATGKAVFALLESTPADVLLLDLRLPDLDGLEVCRQCKARNPALAVLILTSYADDQSILSAIDAGADGYLLKAAADQDIASMIVTVAQGGSVLDPLVTRRILKEVQRQRGPVTEMPEARDRLRLLTRQEIRVLELTAIGRSNKQIAQELHLSDGTVRNYLSVVFAKLGVRSRVEAAALWLRNKLGGHKSDSLTLF